MGSAVIMILAVSQIIFKPLPISVKVGMFVFGVASGAAMIPYSIIKEVNPDNVKGSATGGINFLVSRCYGSGGPSRSGTAWHGSDLQLRLRSGRCSC